ncbi:hypothetical protein [Candidatus Thiodictyon syntrophicum]|jgi:hypothetical protein|uniref:PIN domain-containing protein n=1 Tax=Candidatus Thiodictyon syntrophicum TaxID=1166950 RepID=A0A2K8UA85_9GAMM|nr:hypothetical protein [Candidatus Thiodictyon syntrophicum]AUB82475.1 hypothetical protein THSYN_17015 [Candidatus Thiodictyon syntrophicum]
MRKVLIIDTSILCVWLDVPGKETCGPDHDRWDRPRVDEKIHAEARAGTTFVLPLASIIETGNHIAQAPRSRKERADALADLIRKSADEETPWAAFAHQSELWSSARLKTLADTWPALAAKQISMGDITIKDVAEYHAPSCRVEILTGDLGLKGYEPAAPPEIPRRRK